MTGAARLALPLGQLVATLDSFNCETLRIEAGTGPLVLRSEGKLGLISTSAWKFQP